MRKIANFRFAYPLVLGVILGVISCKAYFEKDYTVLIVDLLIISLYAFIFCYDKKILIFSLIAFLIIFTLSTTVYYFYFKHYQSLYLPSENIYYVYGKVKSVAYYDNCISVKLTNARIEYDYKLINANLQVYVKNGDLKIGDYIGFYSKIEKAFSTKDVSFLSDGIIYKATTDITQIEFLGNKVNFFEKCNLYIKVLLFKNMSEESGAVAYAMLTGTTSYIPTATKDLYRFSGIAHIFSVSGLHISFVAHFLNRITKRINVKKIYKSVFIIIFLIIYSGICNFTLSSIRAVIMCSVLLLCGSFGGKYDILNSLLISLSLTLFVNPFAIYSVGLQLSYLSVFGIITLANTFKRALKKLPDKIGEAISVSLSASVMTLPVMMEVFGYFSIVSVIYNLIFIPLVTFIFLTLIITIIISLLIKLKFILYLADKAIKGINYVLKLSTPEKYIVKTAGLGIGKYFYYLGIVSFSDLINLSYTKKAIIALIFIVIALLCIV